MHIHDFCMTCEECGNTRHLGINCPETQEDVNFINNNNYRPQLNQGWSQQQRSTYQESQIAQLAATVPSTEKDKIPGQPEEVETANLVEIHNVDFYKDGSSRGWQYESMPEKRGDFGQPVIPIKIGPHDFKEAICDLGASVNVITMVIYDHILQFGNLLYTTMLVKLADQSIRKVKGIMYTSWKLVRTRRLRGLGR